MINANELPAPEGTKTPMKTISTATILAAGLLARPIQAQEARPLIHPLFSSNMVLQRDAIVPVWGWAAPGARVSVRFRDRGWVAQAGSDGLWRLSLPPARAGGPYWMRVSAPGAPDVVLENVMMGDVWICSGQSNMEQGLATVVNAEREIAGADHPNIRLYTVPRKAVPEPVWDPGGQWRVCTPKTAGDGGWDSFSAVAYFFGRELHRATGVPIGLIQSTWGGTPAEAWTSAPALSAALPEFTPVIEHARAIHKSVAEGRFDYTREMDRWVAASDPGTRDGWEKPAFDDAAWKTMALPQHWDNAGMADFDGVVWFRRAVDLPAHAAGKAATLSLGPIDDGDTTWVNGVRVGETTHHLALRDYAVPAGILREGRNVVAVRVYDYASNGGFHGKPEDMRLSLEDQAFPLSGDWLYRPSIQISEMGPRPEDPNVVLPWDPTVLYNGMIAPLIPFAIKGVIWYQGESNAARAMQYRTLLPTMIADWRRAWGQGDFPFLIVQIANYMARKPQPSESQWAELREVQALTAATIANSGLAVTIDIGEANDIHPRNKQDVGRRLALAARKVAYGEKGVSPSGPTYRDHEIVNGAIRVFFDNLAGGLMRQDGSNGGSVPGFAVAGADGAYVWADARIAGVETRSNDGRIVAFDGEEASAPGKRTHGVAVIVSSPQVREPRSVRYAWADNPEAGLYNRAGLPAVPFRTDSGMGRLVEPVRLTFIPPPTAPPFTDWYEVSVTVRFTVTPDANIASPEVLRSSDIRFNRAALEAARRIVATPARLNGRPVESKLTHTFVFRAH